MLGLSGFVVVRKLGHRLSISNMKASNHGWIKITISIDKKIMVVLQWFDFLSQYKCE
jgi:hypothetical protein